MHAKSRRIGWMLMAPALLTIGTLTVYPVLYGMWLSLFAKHSFFPEQRFIGLDNYVYLASDLEFWRSTWNGTVYSVSTVALQIVLGVTAALVVHESFRGRNVVRGAVLFPFLIPTVIAVVLWKWLLNGQFGLVNFLLLGLGVVEEPVSWLGSDYIMATLILISVWQFFPFVMLSVLARMQSVPLELYEAATMDGAGPVRRFLHVTLPQLRNVLFVVVLLRSIWMFTKFDTVWLLTQGGGAERYIRTLPVYAYLRTFSFYQAGLGAALGVLMFALLAAATTVYFRLFQRDEEL